jgi:hypothetical protein
MPDLMMPTEIISSAVAVDIRARFQVKIDKSVGFSPKQKAKLDEAVVLWTAVWNSEKFRIAVHSFSYEKTYRVRKGLFWRKYTAYGKNFLESKGLGNMALYEKLLAGSERLSPGDDGIATISVTLDKSAAKGVIGYTYPSTRTQWIYSSFFERATPPVIAGNLAHEYCHKLGFSHSAKFTPTREFTVPYACGYITRDLAKEMWRG